jgi:hypothetical protein
MQAIESFVLIGCTMRFLPRIGPNTRFTRDALCQGIQRPPISLRGRCTFAIGISSVSQTVRTQCQPVFCRQMLHPSAHLYILFNEFFNFISLYIAGSTTADRYPASCSRRRPLGRRPAKLFQNSRSAPSSEQWRKYNKFGSCHSLLHGGMRHQRTIPFG